MPFFRTVADLVEPTSPVADGPPPTLVKCPTRDKEIALVTEQAKRLSGTQTVALLFRDQDDEKLVADKLPRGAIRLHKDMNTWQAGPGIWYGAYHSAKGLEFDAVLLPFFSNARLPDSEARRIYGEDESRTSDGKLVYVAVTRAKTRLVITYSGEITPLLPQSSNLFHEVSV